MQTFAQKEKHPQRRASSNPARSNLAILGFRTMGHQAVQRILHAKNREQTAHVHEGGASEAPPAVHEAMRSPGQPLDPAARAFMEPRFGEDFSQVRVHADAGASRSAAAVNARAYTVGDELV